MTQRDSSTYTENSVVAAVLGDLRDLGRWLESSTVVRTYRQFSASLANAAENSTLARLLSTLGAWLCASYCYRWLTAEPDPEIVVIDLRKTYTVGPFIALLDRAQPSIVAAWNASVLRRLADRLEPNRELLARSRTVRLLAAALKPPEPPDEEKR